MNPSFIAEVSSNHYRDLERCFRFIDEAAAIGCQVVKFEQSVADFVGVPHAVAVSIGTAGNQYQAS